MTRKIKVLSLFDGISCLKVALDRINVDCDYYSSEIDKDALIVSNDNFKDLIRLGDVCKISYKDGYLTSENGSFYVGEIDLLAGGSPCQDFSFAKTNGKGLEGDKSKLFYEYLRILKEVNPKYFLLENVKMKKEYKIKLDEYLGVESVFINSELTSYQTRGRLYWSNIRITQPVDKKISFQNYKQLGELDFYKVNPTKSRFEMWNKGEGTTRKNACRNITYAEKISCITTKQDRRPNSGLIEYEDFCRFLTRQELEGGQNLPHGYTKSISYGAAQKVIGNCWTVGVIEHILSLMNFND